jgi:virulence factor Mce-like protein
MIGRPRHRRSERQMSLPERRARDARVGLLVLLVGVPLIAYVFVTKLTGESPFSNPFQVHMVFRDSLGLTHGSPVRIAGVDVGHVSGVDPGPGGTAIVTAELDDEALPLHDDATAAVRPRTFLEGNYFIDLRPGSPTARDLQDGQTIPVAQTAVPTSADQVLDTLDEPTRAEIKSSFDEFRDAIRGGVPAKFNAAAPHLAPALRDTSLTLEGLAGTRRNDLAGVIRSSARVARAIASAKPELDSLIGSLARVLGTLADHDREVSASLSRLPRVLAVARPALSTLNSALPQARALIDALRPALREAPPTLAVARPALEQANALLAPEELPALVRTGRPAIASLAGVTPDLERDFGLLSGPVSCLLHSALPTLTTPLDDGSLSTGQPVYRDLLDGLVGLSSLAQNYDANGYAIRYQAGLGDEVVATPGSSPGEQLFGFFDQPIVGSRPQPLPAPPPLEPKRPCVDSPAPNLAAPAGNPLVTPIGPLQIP